jgi:hypothetical protein
MRVDKREISTSRTEARGGEKTAHMEKPTACLEIDDNHPPSRIGRKQALVRALWSSVELWPSADGRL